MKAYIHDSLRPCYPVGEVRALTRVIFEYVCKLTLTQQLSQSEIVLSTLQRAAIEAIVHRLQRHEPLQYVLGETQFCSLTLKVNPSVLIPRPETEELASIVADRHSSFTTHHSLLDLCTGSGCLAIALAKRFPNASVTAVDVSATALETAHRNAALNNVNINFLQYDVLLPSFLQTAGSYDIIVSNPPYVLEGEKLTMDANVIEYEPHEALFVPDSDPMRFYRPIAAFAASHLSTDGTLYLEINPLCADKVLETLKTNGLNATEILFDLSGKKRFAVGKKINKQQTTK